MNKYCYFFENIIAKENFPLTFKLTKLKTLYSQYQQAMNDLLNFFVTQDIENDKQNQKKNMQNYYSTPQNSSSSYTKKENENNYYPTINMKDDLANPFSSNACVPNYSEMPLTNPPKIKIVPLPSTKKESPSIYPDMNFNPRNFENNLVPQNNYFNDSNSTKNTNVTTPGYPFMNNPSQEKKSNLISEIIDPTINFHNQTKSLMIPYQNTGYQGINTISPSQIKKIVESKVMNSSFYPKMSENLKKIYLNGKMISLFMNCANENTFKNIETCGILCGLEKESRYIITELIIPNQKGCSDSCSASNEEEMFALINKTGLITIGWIHTHPKYVEFTKDCFLSSIDIHTQFGYQRLLSESIAIVCTGLNKPEK